MIRPILRHGIDVLHRAAKPVDAVTDEVRALVDDMIQTMYAAPGVGLAAPQVGVLGKEVWILRGTLGIGTIFPIFQPVEQPVVGRTRERIALHQQIP